MAQWRILLATFLALADSSRQDVSKALMEERFQNVVKAVTTHCSGSLSPSCVQLDLLSQLESLVSAAYFEVLPGVFLTRNTTAPGSTPVLPPGLSRELDPSTAASVLKPLLVNRFLDQLRSWSLSVQVFNNSTLQQFRALLDPDSRQVQTGRKSKLWRYMGGALLTVAFSVISALISKSLTLSIIALILSVAGGGAGLGFSSSHASPAALSYRSPVPVAAPLRSHPSPPDLQYLDEEDPAAAQQLVYVNRRGWRDGRNDRVHDFYQNHF